MDTVHDSALFNYLLRGGAKRVWVDKTDKSKGKLTRKTYVCNCAEEHSCTALKIVEERPNADPVITYKYNHTHAPTELLKPSPEARAEAKQMLACHMKPAVVEGKLLLRDPGAASDPSKPPLIHARKLNTHIHKHRVM